MRGRRTSQTGVDRWQRADWWGVVLDCPDALALATFYSELLGWPIWKPDDADENDAARLARPSGGGCPQIVSGAGAPECRSWNGRAMVDEGLQALQTAQDGVVSRRQILHLGGDDALIERRLRRRDWARVHDGVYVDHTGPLSWHQRAWAAVLYHWPAALAGTSSLAAHGLRTPRPDEPIELVVDRTRRVRDPAGVRTSQLRRYDDVVLHHLSPPRVRLEHAVLMTASQCGTEDGAVAVLADACQQRRTTSNRLVGRLASMQRLPRRKLLLEVLEDVACGAYSALERRYLRDVERAHGLPVGVRQRRDVVGAAGKVVFRDVEYAEWLTLVELDGRLGHDRAADRWRDLERDLDAAQTGQMSLRAGWQQALLPCRLAVAIAGVLRARGWRGTPHPCREGCPMTEWVDGDRRDPPAPGAGRSPRSAA